MSQAVGAGRWHDCVRWRSSTVVEKFSPSQAAHATVRLGRNPSRDELVALCGHPEEGVHEDLTSNLLTTAGLTRITNLLTGGGSPALTATTARLGVGNSSTVELVTNTDLGAASGAGNRQFYVMDLGYPAVSAGVLVVRATFAASDANFAWAEWGIDIGTPTVANGTTVNACLMNHKVAAMGTKASGGAWSLTANITFS
jgi:hypothetical protein